VRRFVADLLAGRRPRPFPAEPDDEPELRAAIMLRAADADGPSEEFVTGLHERLAQEMVGEPAGSRRRFVRTASVAAAAAAAVGVGAGDLLGRSTAAPATGQVTQAEPTLQPDVGQWRVVAASGELPDGSVRAFDLGSVNGFVARSNGALRAVSGVCTHLGCRLALDAPARQLRCPCHPASFALTGEVLHHKLPISLSPLPLLPVRERDGAVEVFAPPA
jgi:nitrite reductase/ring-hydroxylating ferredoxin subunit